MASDEKELEATERKQRGRRPKSKPQADGNPGLLRVLWADLRKQEVPREPDPEEEAWYQEEEELCRQQAARAGRVHCLPLEHQERFRRRYWS